MIRTNGCNSPQTGFRGMTLIELMVVIAVIGILSGIAYPSYLRYVLKAHRQQALADISKIQLSLEQRYRGGYSSAGVVSGGVCLLCESQPDRYAIDVSISESGYVITATPQAATGQDQDQCAETRYARLSLSSDGEARPKACWY